MTSGFASEIKFLVDPVTGERIREWARTRLEPDPYGEGPSADQYRTSSLYFDTPEFDVFQRRGSYGRSKLRTRRYDGETSIFLERKLRRGTRLNKRRTCVGLDELTRLDGALDPAWAGAWFARRMTVRRLRPVCQITYDRTARVATTETGRIRLTLDEHIRAAPRDTLSFGDDTGVLVAPEGVVLELKYPSVMPALFKQLVEEFRLAPSRVSKYRFAALALGLGPDEPATTATGGSRSATYA